MKLVTKIFRRNDWYVTSPFGWRKHPISGKKAHHNGTDYGTHCKKWPQYAIEDGYVQLTHKGSTGYGNYVWVRYPRLNISLLHAHLDSFVVKKGDKVKEGTLIGYTGKSGRATGVHLHLGMTKIGSNTWLNPHNYDYVPEVKDNVVNPVSRDENKNQIKVLATKLRCRKEPTLKGAIVGFVQTDKYYDYTEIKSNDGYTWYKIADNQWVASDGKYLEVLPKKEPVPVEEFKVGDVVVPTKLVDYRGHKLVQYDSKYVISSIDKRGYILRAIRGNQRPIWAVLPKENIKKV